MSVEVDMNNKLKQCPVCNSTLDIVEYNCGNCHTTIRGKFTVGDFAALSPAQQEFVKVFVCCSGNIKEVERALKISYPTVKNRLADVTKILCDRPQPAKQSFSEDILADIESGNLSVDEAIARMKGGKNG